MSDDGFIGLPPGIVPSVANPDSGTVRRERPERSRSGADEIVFFPAAPGMSAPAPAAAPAPAEAAPVAEAPPVWRLSIPGHDTVTVRGVLYIGRNPSSPVGRPGGELLAVDDETRSLSKTHAMLELESGALWVHDLGSTNGVWVVPADGDAVEVIPGQRTAVPDGGELELGDLVIGVARG